MNTKIMLFIAICACNNESFSSPENNPSTDKGKKKLYNNPIISGLGVCDPHIHIFNNRAYLFASHDEKPGNSFYTMYDWWIWSSEDLVNWELKYTLDPRYMWTGPTKNCWAVDAASRNGKFYFYVSSNWNTGVAVSESGPDGPYKDALNRALYSNYDPTVFIDDDENKTPYLITSEFPYEIAKLNNDMISLAEKPRKITHTSQSWNGDGGFIHKKNGLYYLNGHGSDYSTSSNIYGPYTYRGKFHSTWIDHPTFFSWNNQDYCAFGTRDNDQFFRKTFITYAYYKKNGDIIIDKDVANSFIGVGEYDCNHSIQAEWYFYASDGLGKVETDHGFAVAIQQNNAILFYPKILNIAKNATFEIRVASTDISYLEIREDSKNGNLIGEIEIPNTSGTDKFINIKTSLNCDEGTHNLYLLFHSNKPNLKIDWFRITPSQTINPPTETPTPVKRDSRLEKASPCNAFGTIEAENFIDFEGGIQVGDCFDSKPDKKICFIENDTYCSYKLNFSNYQNKKILFNARIASQNSKGGYIEIREDSSNGKILGQLKVPYTSSWNKWETVECMIATPQISQNIYLIFKGDNGYLFDLNWFKFVPIK